jgi:hypothetical protein
MNMCRFTTCGGLVDHVIDRVLIDAWIGVVLLGRGPTNECVRHVAHCPLQVPKFYYDQFEFMEDDEGHCASQTVKGVHTIDPHNPDLEYKCRQQYHAMVMTMDEAVGNITAAMKAKQMWENTLVIMSSDNGGPVTISSLSPS